MTRAGTFGGNKKVIFGVTPPNSSPSNVKSMETKGSFLGKHAPKTPIFPKIPALVMDIKVEIVYWTSSH